MRHFDVIVVGGGPAGSTCAYELAKAGVNVAIFDHSHPREKPCGGGLPRRFFEDFDVPKGVRKRIIDWIILEDQHGHRVRLYQKFGGVTIMRKDFDRALLDKAEKSGALNIKERVIKINNSSGNWIVNTERTSYESDFLIGADGCNSIVRKFLIGDIEKWNLDHAVGYHIKHNSFHLKNKFEDAIELYFLGKPYVKNGYIWIFPKMDYVTIGLGTSLGTRNIKQSLDLFIKEHPAAKRIIIPTKLSLHSHMLPSANSPDMFNKRITGKNWALIGDAAGHVNPITGEGIYYAMMGGKLVAKAYLEGDILHYEGYWRKVYGADLYWGSRIKKFFYNPRVIDIAIEVGKRSETMREILADIVASRLNYDRIILRKIPLKAPKILFEILFRRRC